jgi:ABC-2 type transport system permease protein
VSVPQPTPQPTQRPTQRPAPQPERPPLLSRSLTTLQVVLLVAGLAWRRIANRLSHAMRRRSPPGERAATPRTAPPGRGLVAIFGGLVLVQTISSTARLVARFAEHAKLTADMARDDGLRFRVELADPGAAWPSADLWFPEHPDAMLVPLALMSGLIGLVAFLQCLVAGGRDLADVGTRAEWLFGFPVPARALFLAQALAISLNPIFAVLVWPFFAVVFWCAGLGVGGVLLSLLATLYVGVLCGAGRILLETSLRRFLVPINIARFQAVLYLMSSVVMMLTIALVYSPQATRIVEVAEGLPRGWLFSPFALPIWIAAKGAAAWSTGVVLLGVAAASLYLSARGCERLVRNGIVTATTQFQAARKPGKSALTAQVDGMWQKELWAMLRERQVRTQAFIAPGLLLLTQFIVNPGLVQLVTASPQAIASASFALAAFVLLGASTGLANESPTLPLLGSFPVPLERLLLQKAAVWGVLGSVYACLGFGVFAAQQPRLEWASVAYLPMVLLGVALYSVIALCLGALGTDPHELEPHRRVGMGTIYQHLMLITVFGVGLHFDGLWTQGVLLVLSALLAFALWQKLKDRVPYLQDPSAAPPPQLSVTDGVLAALVFFVLQGAFSLVLEATSLGSQLKLLIAFSIAGTLVTVLGLWQLRRSGVPEPWRAIGLAPPAHWSFALRAVGAGVGIGACGAVLAFVYLMGVEHTPWLRDALDFEPESPVFDMSNPRLVVVLAVLAAPIVEEFIFRGLLYGGFRRSLAPIPAALGSASVFALVHPAVAAFPVFGLALGAAFVYERTKWLGAPIAAHMTYNGILALGAVFGADT